MSTANVRTVWTFRGARIIRIESIRDRSDALKAVGLAVDARPAS